MDKDLAKKLAKDLVPSNPNLSRRRQNPNKSSVETKRSETEVVDWSGDFDPFLNPKEFVDFYKSKLRIAFPNAKFEIYRIDTRYAAELMDKMIEHDREDKDFLSAWIVYYIANYLKGMKALNTKHTAIDSFASTFDDFNKMYVGRDTE